MIREINERCYIQKNNGELVNDVKIVSNKKDYLKLTLKPRYMLHKVIDNALVAIGKSRVAWILKNPVYIDMIILDLSKVLMRKFKVKCSIIVANSNVEFKEYKK